MKLLPAPRQNTLDILKPLFQIHRPSLLVPADRVARSTDRRRPWGKGLSNPTL